MHCAARVEHALKHIDGVKSAQVNFGAEKATIEYDVERVQVNTFVKTIRDLGYEPLLEKVTFPAAGMSCASCVAKVENAIKRLDGVVEAQANLALGNATVTLVPGTVSLGDIARSVQEAGYSVPDQTVSSETQESILSSHQTQEAHQLLIKTAVCIAITTVVLLGSFRDAIAFIPGGFGKPFLLWFLASIVQFWGGSQFYKSALKSLKRLTSDMNTLIAVGSSAAYLYSVSLIIFPSFFQEVAGHYEALYFDTSSVIITLILLGRLLETRARGRASEAIRHLVALQPRTARVVHNSHEEDVPIEKLSVGDIVIVRPGERIPVDGVVLEGLSLVNESMLSGEPIAITKTPGDEVIGGTINETGSFRFRATRVGKETVLAQIIKLVEEAQNWKPPIQRLADVVAARFVPAVIAIAILTFFVWYIFGPHPALTYALSNFIAVLIIACPCALGLATPTAVIVGMGKGAENGILIKSGEALETAYRLDTIVLDKTGTITRGEPAVTDVIPAEGFDNTGLIRLAASAEKSSEHPLAKAILEFAKTQGIEAQSSSGFEAIPGTGVRAKVDTHVVLIGSRKLLEQERLDVADRGVQNTRGESIPSNLQPNVRMTTKPIITAESLLAIGERLADEGKTPVYVMVDQAPAGVIGIADVPKPGAVEAVDQIRRMGFEVIMITGDDQRTAQAIAKQVGVERVVAEVLPAQKAEEIRRLKQEGRHVAMVGDGINDAPALAEADVGIAIGAGTDVAIEAADITLVSNDIRAIVTAIRLSQATMRIIRQNLFWAFFYNVALIPTAAGLLYPFFGLMLNPMWAAAAMAFSSVSVVSNSLRLKRFKIKA